MLRAFERSSFPLSISDRISEQVPYIVELLKGCIQMKYDSKQKIYKDSLVKRTNHFEGEQNDI
jgi:hypothetical protein